MSRSSSGSASSIRQLSTSGDMTALRPLLLLPIVVGGFIGFAAYTARQGSRSPCRRAGRFLELDGWRIHYVDKGAGPPLFLIHGLGGQLRKFHLCARRPPRERVPGRSRSIVPDRAIRPVRPAPTPAFARKREIMAKVINTLNLDRPLVVGHSHGRRDRARARARPSRMRQRARADRPGHPGRQDAARAVSRPRHSSRRSCAGSSPGRWRRHWGCSKGDRDHQAGVRAGKGSRGFRDGWEEELLGVRPQQLLRDVRRLGGG